ncbi:MAG: metallophosphoesterase family protein [Acidobacteria bacterium]|nr:metallophosphoesterase family protein [Acidobacteriota bacterium]
MWKRLLLLLLVLLAALWSVFAYRESRHLEVNHQEIVLARLHPDFEGFRILLISDLHLTEDSAFTQQLQDRMESIPADLLLIAGDFKDLYYDEKTAMSQLSRLLVAFEKFPQVYAVNGNVDTTQMVRDVEAMGIRVLRNEREILKRGQGTLGIAGAFYPYSTAGLERSLQRFQDERGVGLPDCDILLAHSPDVILWGPASKADLILAGHTHGGQVRLPVVGAVTTRTRLGRHYASGLFKFGNIQLFITRGVGTTFLPLRFLCPPEIVVITLHRAR